jgi:hypothetical protein
MLSAITGVIASLELVGPALADARASQGTTGGEPVVSCESLLSLSLTNTTVDSAAIVPANATTPAHCAVKLTVNNPPSDDQVRVGGVPARRLERQVPGHRGWRVRRGNPLDQLPDEMTVTAKAGDRGLEGRAAVGEGPRDQAGDFLWYGLPRGASMGALNFTVTAPDATTTGIPFLFSLNHFIYWLARDPGFDWTTLTFDEYVDYFHQSVAEFNDVIGTSDPDLSAFRDAGGKIVALVGTYDQLIYPQGSIDYYGTSWPRWAGSRGPSGSSGSSSRPASRTAPVARVPLPPIRSGRSSSGWRRARLPNSCSACGETAAATS